MVEIRKIVHPLKPYATPTKKGHYNREEHSTDRR